MKFWDQFKKNCSEKKNLRIFVKIDRDFLVEINFKKLKLVFNDKNFNSFEFLGY